ncbi:MAG: DNA-binding response OmpR family regulator [Candidatus Latescibacterota bacterium]|jgi:DNA-binding response OmpR family regulator
MRILIAEDESVSRRLLEGLLQTWGHEVVVCTDGDTAWEILQRADAPRLAIMDWMMPGLSGIEICQNVRTLENGDQFYMLLVTARGGTGDLVDGLKAGANDYVSKPYHPAELEARVNAGLRMIELQAKQIEAERVKTLMATAGAAAHEINQPLTVILGSVELWRDTIAKDDPGAKHLECIWEGALRIQVIVEKMMSVTQFATKPYVGDSVIVDFDASSDKIGADDI